MSTMYATPSSHGWQTWTDRDFERLVDMLRGGALLSDIATSLRRTPGALRAQITRLIPPEYVKGMTERQREQWLRYELEVNPSYNWRIILREEYASRGQRYWSAEDEEVLQTGWQERQPLEELCGVLRASDMEVARQLLALGLATSTRGVADRLGVIPGGTVDIRLRLERDRAAASLWSLVVDGPMDSLRSVSMVSERGRREHHSMHVSYDQAVEEFDRLLLRHYWQTDDDPEPFNWSIVERTAGEGTAGIDHYGTYPDLHPGAIDR